MLRSSRSILGLTGRRTTAGFSLIEVVLALGIAVFSGFVLIALFATGLADGQDSKERFQAASIAEGLISARRGAPLSTTVTDVSGNNPLPLDALDPAPNGGVGTDAVLTTPKYLTWDGAVTDAAGTKGPPRFCLIYNIIYTPIPSTSTTSGTSVVYLCLYWPPTPNPAALGSRSGHFEITTTFTLPPS